MDIIEEIENLLLKLKGGAPWAPVDRFREAAELLPRVVARLRELEKHAAPAPKCAQCGCFISVTSAFCGVCRGEFPALTAFIAAAREGMAPPGLQGPRRNAVPLGEPSDGRCPMCNDYGVVFPPCRGCGRGAVDREDGWRPPGWATGRTFFWGWGRNVVLPGA